MTELLRVTDLRGHSPLRRGIGQPGGTVEAVDGVSFAAGAGKTMALVGESGCGASTTAHAVVGLERAPGGTAHLEEARHRAGRRTRPRRVGPLLPEPGPSTPSDIPDDPDPEIGRPHLATGHKRLEAMISISEPHRLRSGRRDLVSMRGTAVMAFCDTTWCWLSASLSGHEHTAPPAWAYSHARLMVLGWSILIPLGMMIARFFKVWPGQRWPEVLDNPIWWRLHVFLQSLGVAAMSLGVLLAFGRGAEGSSMALWHHRAGWTLVCVGWAQVAAGVLRGSKGGPTAAHLRGDHYDMTPRRLAFEYLHKSLGWAAWPVVVVTTAVGLVMLDAPRWMALLVGGWWAALAAAFAFLQASGRCFDTYQAIWGTAPEHPGNARRPIGWRVSRRPHTHDAPRTFDRS